MLVPRLDVLELALHAHWWQAAAAWVAKLMYLDSQTSTQGVVLLNATHCRVTLIRLGAMGTMCSLYRDREAQKE